MPSYVDFNASKHFRDFVLAKTLTAPNGPQTFNESNYSVHNLNTFANVDPGDVEDTRAPELLKSQNSNTFKPIEYFVRENFNTFARRANLNLYPYFVGNVHNLIGIMSTDSYEDESELMKFAAWNIRENPEGPFFARLQQNLYTATVGRVRLIDALQGNTTTAINLVTGREPLIEANPRITVASSLPGKAIDFLQTVAGVEFPWQEIPGDYLSNPRNPIAGNVRSEAKTEAGRIAQDASGVLGSLLGVQRRPTTTMKPSDLFIEYMGQRQRATLFNNLSYSKYAPDYTTTARSQNTSKVFNFIDKTAQSVKNFLGVEAPKGVSYIGDDRGNTVYYAMNDLNDRPVRSSYYLTMMFDSVQATLFQRTKTIGEGGGTAGKLTWISSKSKNQSQSSSNIVGMSTDQGGGRTSKSYSRTQNDAQYAESLSTARNFRSDSLLGLTQGILETMPTDGGAARSHVANVIDQTSRIFRDGDIMMSKGSAIKYVDQFTGLESGVEYCRVWTKDKSYMNYSDTMKKSGNYRKFESSVLTNSWNLNIHPNSNAKGEFDTSSTNMGQRDGGFFAKKYMFSIENLAWKTSDTPGFTYTDLPYCERGPNNGRIMWFPPYDLKVSEQNNAKWEENIFLGRPEPIYTYANTSRAGQVSFKVIVDHPSILNLLVKKHFEGMSDEAADNYINAFFAGCEDVDFYGLVRKYTTLTPDEVKAVMAYLNENKDPQPVTRNKSVLTPIVKDTPTPKNTPPPLGFDTTLYFENRMPELNDPPGELYSYIYYTGEYNGYESNQGAILQDLNAGLNILAQSPTWGADQINDYGLLTGIPNKTTKPTTAEFNALINKATLDLQTAFSTAAIDHEIYVNETMAIKSMLEDGKIKDLYIKVGSSASSVDTANNNLKLSYRRSYSVLSDFIFRLCTHFTGDPERGITTPHYDSLDQYNKVIDKYLTWKINVKPSDTRTIEPKIIIPLKELGYPQEGNLTIDETHNVGETLGSKNTTISDVTNVSCSDTAGFRTSDHLKRTAPSTFYCRSTKVTVTYNRNDGDTDTTADAKAAAAAPSTERNLVEVNGDSPNGMKLSPSIDEMKKMIMKTLSECYYFRKLEEDSPLQFSSLKEKLKYFHPAFHSMTPEGLNARLTFLNQCVRPGDTLPIKGISDERDMNARNTTFGPPPICVMRIGDFYHSKIVIRDVNITFDENVWDLNPEGIGVQPMIANVTLQINFIGGHGLEKPVERLQNALSSNFYANTEMYDPRSTATEDRTKFYKDTFKKEFLDDLNNRANNPTAANPSDNVTSANKITEGVYIGQLEMSGSTYVLQYNPLIDQLYEDTEAYYESLMTAYNSSIITYGPKISSMILHPDYRSIKDYTVQTGVGTDTIELLGNYPRNLELEMLTLNFRNVLSGKTQSENITTLTGIYKDMTPSIAARCEQTLNPYVVSAICKKIDSMVNVTAYMKDMELKRNSVVTDLDKLNYILQYGHDGKIALGTQEYVAGNIVGYTSDKIYNTYSELISFIKNNHTGADNIFSEDLDTSYNFYSYTMNTNDLSSFLSVLLRTEKNNILDLFKNDKTIFTDRVIKNMEKRLDAFLAPMSSGKDFGINRYPVRANSNDIEFAISGESTITNSTEIQDLTNVKRTSGYKPTTELNYAR